MGKDIFTDKRVAKANGAGSRIYMIACVLALSSILLALPFLLL